MTRNSRINDRHERCIPSVALAEHDVKLSFQPFTPVDMPQALPLLHSSRSRSCDFTAGGVFMWVDYFGYERCIVGGDTLFMRGLSEDFTRRPAFSLPVGRMPLSEAVEALRGYCRENNVPLFFSAVPEDRLEELRDLGVESVEELTDWADYIYNAEDLATLKGKAYSKKRNHVNRFIADNPDYRLDTISESNIDELIEFFSALDIESEKADPVMAEYEREQCLEVLRNYSNYPFEGAVLRDNSGKIVAFTAGEIVGDTLILHIEKMRHDVSGAGEAINKLFAERMLSEHPDLRYINREDDSGDPGLRFAKESYHPAFKLRKFNVLMK